MTEKEIAEKMGYEGCRNCEHQIAPLRSCKWAEQGGDGVVHIICPMWDKRRETETAEKDYNDDLYEDWMFFDKGETE